MKNIHVLPTDKPSRLFKDNFNTLFFSINIDQKQNYFKPQHIYITSDEEIKQGDWGINLAHNMIVKPTDAEWANSNSNNLKKIILTTDQDLIKDGVQAIEDEFLEWFVKNPSCESIEIDKMHLCIQTGLPCGMQCLSKETCNENINYKIIISKEKLKTSEEWQKQFPNTKVIDPDGWDRKNYQYSWFEQKITLAEYTTRLSRSTIYGIIPKEEQKQHLIDMMQKDEELGLYDIFNDEKRQGVKELIDKHKQDDENYLDSFGVTKTQFEVYRNFNKKETLEEAAEKYSEPYKCPATNENEYCKHDIISAFLKGAKWQQEQIGKSQFLQRLRGTLSDAEARRLIFETFKNK